MFVTDKTVFQLKWIVGISFDIISSNSKYFLQRKNGNNVFLMRPKFYPIYGIWPWGRKFNYVATFFAHNLSEKKNKMSFQTVSELCQWETLAQ